MAQKLYNRQGGNIQGIGVQQPLQPDMTKAKIVGQVGNTLETLATKNYELGKAELISSTIDNAYQIAPDNLAKFDELIQDNLTKATDNIPEKWREDVLLAAKPKVDARRKNVIDNYTKKLNDEFISNVLATGDQGMRDQMDANQTAFTAIVQQDKDGLQVARAFDAQTRRKLYELSQAKDYKGNYIIGDKAMRSMMENGQFNKLETAKYNIEQMSLDELKDFDKTTFQDKNAFIEAYGINDETYTDIEKVITGRLKALGDEEKRIVTAQNQFNAARMIVDFNEEELDKLDDSALPKDFKKNIKSAIEDFDNIPVNAAFADDSFLNSVKELESVFMDTGNGKDLEHNKELLQAGINALNNISNFASTVGMDADDKAHITRALYEGLASQEFANTMKPLYSDSRLNDVINNYAYASGDYLIGEPLYRKLRQQKDPFALQHTNDIERAMKATASNVIKEAFALAALGRFDEAQQRISQGNEEVIRISYSKIIPKWEFKRMEDELKAGKKPMITIGGKTLLFKGYDANDVLVETKL